MGRVRRRASSPRQRGLGIVHWRWRVPRAARAPKRQARGRESRQSLWWSRHRRRLAPPDLPREPEPAGQREEDVFEGRPPRLVRGGRNGSRWRPAHADQRTLQAVKAFPGGSDQPARGGGIAVIRGDPGGGANRGGILWEAARGRRGRGLLGELSTIRAPSAMSASAAANPRPRLPPVTTYTLSRSPRSMQPRARREGVNPKIRRCQVPLRGQAVDRTWMAPARRGAATRGRRQPHVRAGGRPTPRTGSARRAPSQRSRRRPRPEPPPHGLGGDRAATATTGAACGRE
jgi:hypothetical protein